MLVKGSIPFQYNKKIVSWPKQKKRVWIFQINCWLIDSTCVFFFWLQFHLCLVVHIRWIMDDKLGIFWKQKLTGKAKSSRGLIFWASKLLTNQDESTTAIVKRRRSQCSFLISFENDFGQLEKQRQHLCTANVNVLSCAC